MKITEEKLKELKQLDRIEFRQRYKQLEDNQISMGTFDLIWKIFIILGFALIIFAILLVGGYKESAQSLANSLILVVRIATFVIVISFVLDIIFTLLLINKKSKLIKEYFDIKIKARR